MFRASLEQNTILIIVLPSQSVIVPGAVAPLRPRLQRLMDKGINGGHQRTMTPVNRVRASRNQGIENLTQLKKELVRPLRRHSLERRPGVLFGSLLSRLRVDFLRRLNIRATSYFESNYTCLHPP